MAALISSFPEPHVTWSVSGCRSQSPGSAQQGLFFSCPRQSEAASSPGAGVVTTRGSSAQLFLSPGLRGPRRVAAHPVSHLCSRREGEAATGGLGERREARPLRLSLSSKAAASLEPPASAHARPEAGRPQLQGSRGSESFEAGPVPFFVLGSCCCYNKSHERSVLKQHKALWFRRSESVLGGSCLPGAPGQRPFLAFARLSRPLRPGWRLRPPSRGVQHYCLLPTTPPPHKDPAITLTPLKCSADQQVRFHPWP